MATRTLNRRELRKQAEHAGQSEAAEALPAAPPKRKARGAAATPAPRKPRAKKAPPRMRARWGVFDGGMKPVAMFDYNQRAAADAKLADMLARGKGTYILQIIKEPMPEPAPAAAPAG